MTGWLETVEAHSGNMTQAFRLDAENRRTLETCLGLYSEVAEIDLQEEDGLLGRLSRAFLRDGRIGRREDLMDVIRWKWWLTPSERVEQDLGRLHRVSQEAFTRASSGETERAIEVLCELKGVGTRMATAILMFYDSDRYTVMDVNAWKSLVHLGAVDVFDCGWESASDYPQYVEACTTVKERFGHSLRETDRALWTMGALKGQLPESTR